MQRSHILTIVVTVAAVSMVILAVNNLLISLDRDRDPLDFPLDQEPRFPPVDPNDPLLAKISPEEAQEIALQFLRRGPTFEPGSGIDVVEVREIPVEGGPSARFNVRVYEITIDFVTGHPGYGIRDIPDSAPRNCRCEHTIEIWVQGRVVTKAIIDETWDELKQELIT